MKTKNIKENKGYNIFVYIALSFLVLLIVGGVVYAEYTKSTRAKRVIAAYSEEGMLFSSNYMSISSVGLLNKRILYVNDQSQRAGTEITVCNYVQGNTMDVYSKNILYDVVVKLVKVTGSERSDASYSDVGEDLTVSVKYKNGTPITLSRDNLSHTFNNGGSHNVLTGYVATTDPIEVEFSSAFNTESNIYLEVQANLYPNAASYTGLSNLYAVFNPTLKNQDVPSIWSGEFNERKGESDPLPYLLDGYNYIITGNGVGTVRLKWLTDVLSINDLFLVKNSLTPHTDGDYTYIDIPVDSSDIDRYDLQFYKKTTISSSINWATFEGYVITTFTPSNP